MERQCGRTQAGLELSVSVNRIRMFLLADEQHELLLDAGAGRAAPQRPSGK